MAEIIGFVGSSHVDRSLNFDAQRCINLYPVVSSSGTSKAAAKLASTPGLLLVADKTADNAIGVRGMLVFNDDTLFAVIGSKVYRFNSGGAGVLIGAIPFAATPVSMETNGIEVVVMTGPKGFVINPTTNIVTEIIDPSFFGADAVGFINGSFVYNEPGSSRFWVMDEYSTVIDPLYFATAEGTPDGLVTLVVNHQEIWLMGTSTIEVWAGNGGADFPYSRVAGVFMEQGCAAKNSVAKLEDSIFWLSANENGQGLVLQSQGYGYIRASDETLEQAIAQYETITDAVAYTYQQEGHAFYVLTFPTADVTHVYDATTKTWHQRAWRQESGQFARHRSNCHAFFARKNLVGDWEDGKIYALDAGTFTDNGNPLVRLRSSPHIATNMIRIPHASVEFELETGVGTTGGQGYDPEVMLRWSDDHGHTWSSQRRKKIGKTGEFRNRARFTRLGQARDRIYELSISDPVKFSLISAQLNAE